MAELANAEVGLLVCLFETSSLSDLLVRRGGGRLSCI